MEEDNPFEYFKKKGVEVPVHIKNILSQLGFIGFRIISEINVDQLDEIISDVKEVLGHSSEPLSLEEKEKIFGPVFATKPDMFKFLAGERTILKTIVELSKSYLSSIAQPSPASSKENSIKKKSKANSVSLNKVLYINFNHLNFLFYL